MSKGNGNSCELGIDRAQAVVEASVQIFFARRVKSLIPSRWPVIVIGVLAIIHCRECYWEFSKLFDLKVGIRSFRNCYRDSGGHYSGAGSAHGS